MHRAAWNVTHACIHANAHACLDPKHAWSCPCFSKAIPGIFYAISDLACTWTIFWSTWWILSNATIGTCANMLRLLKNCSRHILQYARSFHACTRIIFWSTWSILSNITMGRCADMLGALRLPVVPRIMHRAAWNMTHACIHANAHACLDPKHAWSCPCY